MNDRLHRTDTINPNQDVYCRPQKMQWVEFQLLDERGEPLANMPYRATSKATRINYVPEFSGVSDAQGVIRLEEIHPLAVTLLIAADPLAQVLQTRRLRALRAEPNKPLFSDPTPLYSPQRSGFSPIEEQALAAGHTYHYLRIGQICDQLPNFDPPLPTPKQPPAYHFPDPRYSGFTVEDDQLDRRHVLEICPLRAWSLVLHHQSQYSLANAYNLGLMSILAYSNVPDLEFGSVRQLFEQQCLDLSRTPLVRDGSRNWPCLVTDVPFDGRYTDVQPLDTSKAPLPEGNTQLFYAISASQVLVAWRGTEMNGLADLASDLTFRPVAPEVSAMCETKVPCAGLTPEGSVHMGFRDAFEVARRVYARHLGEVIPIDAEHKGLFVCGHSLGGALALVHAASLKDQSPLLYTYGMPRTFTLKAIQSLSELWHFRHVNDADVVPRVPPEAAMDNYLYDIWGPAGIMMGFSWSVRQAAVTAVYKHGDPFSHHGEIAMFYTAEQHTQRLHEPYPAYRDPSGRPYLRTIAYLLPRRTKLYLVPSLSETDSQQASNNQENLIKSLDAESLARHFPRYGNPDISKMLGIGDHFMSKYQPYIHDQLMELINPAREELLDLQVERNQFEQQMKEHYERIPEDEYSRNQLFLGLQDKMETALRITSESEGGPEALQRFDNVASSKAFYAKSLR
ncbi:lipase family protein [Pseudomonas huanghezhanensis]|uniref:lipase family protein n=1 Tax=Pseudomonas huanghezhanensis TaxID=3002903 RepID=UPI0022863B65|nr:lipase family protein [Pseudomonas sp. BSw22131]